MKPSKLVCLFDEERVSLKEYKNSKRTGSLKKKKKKNEKRRRKRSKKSRKRKEKSKRKRKRKKARPEDRWLS